MCVCVQGLRSLQVNICSGLSCADIILSETNSSLSFLFSLCECVCLGQRVSVCVCVWVILGEKGGRRVVGSGHCPSFVIIHSFHSSVPRRLRLQRLLQAQMGEEKHNLLSSDWEVPPPPPPPPLTKRAAEKLRSCSHLLILGRFTIWPVSYCVGAVRPRRR